MTVTLVPAPVFPALLVLAKSTRPERAAQALPVNEVGFLMLVSEAHPQLEYACQRRAGQDATTIHVWRDEFDGEFVVYIHRGNGHHGVQESGYPWHDRLTRLAGMWDASALGGDPR